MNSGQNISAEDILSIGEWLDGPSIVAIKGGNTVDSENKISKNESDWYKHSRGKIFCIESGLVHVSTPNGSWVLPWHIKLAIDHIV